MVLETAGGACLSPAPELSARARLAAADPHFDVLEGDGRRYLLAQCSRFLTERHPDLSAAVIAHLVMGFCGLLRLAPLAFRAEDAYAKYISYPLFHP